MTAVPMRRPGFAASARRESGAAAMPEPVTALAAVVMPYAAATPAAPTARRRRILMYCLLCATKSPSRHFESFERNYRDGAKLRLREPNVNSSAQQGSVNCGFLCWQGL